MTESTGEKWKRMGNISTPTFTGSKIKLMSPLVQISIDKLMVRLEQRHKENQYFNIYADFGCLTSDVITSTVLNYDTGVFNTKDSASMKNLILFFNGLDQNRMKETTFPTPYGLSSDKGLFSAD